MNISDAREHAAHLCDVYLAHGDHIGVIACIQEHPAEPKAFVTGHPEYPGLWLYVSGLETSCTITKGQ